MGLSISTDQKCLYLEKWVWVNSAKWNLEGNVQSLFPDFLHPSLMNRSPIPRYGTREGSGGGGFCEGEVFRHDHVVPPSSYITRVATTRDLKGDSKNDLRGRVKSKQWPYPETTKILGNEFKFSTRKFLPSILYVISHSDLTQQQLY